MFKRTLFFVYLTIVVASLLLVSHLFLDFNHEYIFYGLMIVVGSYVGADAIATVVKSRTMPLGQKYTISEGKMRKIVWIMWGLFTQTTILQIIAMNLHLLVSYDLMLAFLCTTSITGIFVGEKKANNASENISDEKYIK